MNVTDEGCASCAAVPPPANVTRSNVPVYLVGSGSTYSIVIDAPAIWGSLNMPDSFALSPATFVPGELGATPELLLPRSSSSGYITLTGSQAEVSYAGTHLPAYSGCGSMFGCTEQMIVLRVGRRRCGHLLPDEQRGL